MRPNNSDVDRRDELEACREDRPPRGASNGDDAVFERLSKPFERRTCELGQLVEEENTAVPECSEMSLGQMLLYPLS
jgi:hypothetical protein